MKPVLFLLLVALVSPVLAAETVAFDKPSDLDRWQIEVGKWAVQDGALLHSDALRDRLSQGQNESFIAGLLQAGTVEAVAEYLAQTLGVSETPRVSEAVELLRRYLKKLQVRKVRLADFTPSKRTLEAEDIEAITEEFRSYLLDALAVEGDEYPLIELE